MGNVSIESKAFRCDFTSLLNDFSAIYMQWSSLTKRLSPYFDQKPRHSQRVNRTEHWSIHRNLYITFSKLLMSYIRSIPTWSYFKLIIFSFETFNWELGKGRKYCVANQVLHKNFVTLHTKCSNQRIFHSICLYMLSKRLQYFSTKKNNHLDMLKVFPVHTQEADVSCGLWVFICFLVLVWKHMLKSVTIDGAHI